MEIIYDEFKKNFLCLKKTKSESRVFVDLSNEDFFDKVSEKLQLHLEEEISKEKQI
jgi:hypothetical protein